MRFSRPNINLDSPSLGRTRSLRHTAITKLAERIAGDRTIMAIARQTFTQDAGALQPRSHGSQEQGIGGYRAAGLSAGLPTTVTTIWKSRTIGPPHLMDRFGGADETRTRDLPRDWQAKPFFLVRYSIHFLVLSITCAVCLSLAGNLNGFRTSVLIRSIPSWRRTSLSTTSLLLLLFSLFHQYKCP